MIDRPRGKEALTALVLDGMERQLIRAGCLMYCGTTVAVSNNLKALLIITERVDERVVVGRLDTMAIMTASYLSCMRVSAWLSWLLSESSSSNSLAGSVVAESRLPPKTLANPKPTTLRVMLHSESKRPSLRPYCPI